VCTAWRDFDLGTRKLRTYAEQSAEKELAPYESLAYSRIVLWSIQTKSSSKLLLLRSRGGGAGASKAVRSRGDDDLRLVSAAGAVEASSAQGPAADS
jgi:hypothetical protein